MLLSFIFFFFSLTWMSMHIIPQNETTLSPHGHATPTFPWHLHETVCARARNITYHTYEWGKRKGRRTRAPQNAPLACREVCFVVVLDNGTRHTSGTHEERRWDISKANRMERFRRVVLLYAYTQFSRGPRFLLFCAEVNREADRVPSRFECGTRCQFFLVPPFVPLPTCPYVLNGCDVAAHPVPMDQWWGKRILQRSGGCT